MTGGAVPDPFAMSDGSLEAPLPIVPTPAAMTGALRGRRVLIGLPGHGWRGDLRADEKVVQGSRTYVPVMQEGEWYRAEAEQTEVFAPLIPVERVWVEDFGIGGLTTGTDDLTSKLVSLDEPSRRSPVKALDAPRLTGLRVVRMLEAGEEQRDLRAVTEMHTNNDGDICVRVTTELEWYRWSWSGRVPRTLEVPVHMLWLE
ncbi:hypothetical protein Ade02nite_38450 [Paractinoplanes deccanensis]|uniref:DUF2169 domain-containing protein n=1 Tax=Paractinoplanes deccanensis TaxID=113561 RepID=A0ABQ3Y5C8_9ACTN|nr:hypothetical protein [Actinoplanes deccanensis]GID75204.1 hypothetical protein Ade02nite_38450 [Actinoplanes deccanensis]